ncbi:hypothetical protein D9611_009350 [Ephemerocybe angulata]|uniref:Uncharacterized protein n=1 Tax=Ephemerocybe angulata TaxID=980116 RepID=A0A8H5F482_9AGAR|nr:hypothetical protein D9611_009350 [Tulosesus angulatus]
MSTATSTLTPEQTQSILATWKEAGPSEAEHDEFIANALLRLSDPVQVKALVDDVAQLAQLAAEIDETFVDVEKILWVVVYLFWPIGIPLMGQWVGFKERWRTCLRSSCVLASTTADILKRFDEIYLDKVEKIQTEQDRLAAMQALDALTKELDANDQSADMSRQFLDLKRDIEAFVNKFNLSATKTAIEPLLADIATLDEQIISAQKAIGGASGSIVAALRLGARASSVVASLEEQREKKVESIRDLRRAMKAMTELVEPSPKLASEQIVAPDIGLMLSKLVVFSEIWSSVRSQNVQFRAHIAGGLEAATNSRFKSEVKLARAQCKPLEAGLLEYKKQLESWV